jgi:hypothetical protein
LHELETWIIAGTSSSVIASKSENHDASVSGGERQWPPEGSGLRLQPTKPSSSTQRRSSATHASRLPSGVCGSWQTPAKCSGKSPVTRWTRSLQARAQTAATCGSATWCSIDDACGEMIVKSPPRSRMIRSWFCSIEARISSSGISG